MSLRNQPYFPLYVQDYLTDEKLNSCSAATQGVYIKILCILHKSDHYGKLLFKQKDKQKSTNIENFALKLCKLLPFDYDTILSALVELVEESVIKIDDNELIQNRMYKDGQISIKRSEAGKKGGNPKLYKQNSNQNTEYENEIESDIESVIELKSKKGKIPELLEVIEYFKIKGSTEEQANHYYDFYESNGWKVGKNPMKNWKAAVHNWLRNKFENGNTTRSKQRPGPLAEKPNGQDKDGTKSNGTGNQLLDQFLNNQRFPTIK